MIARVADHCFWLGRYLERAESTARVLSVTDNLALDAELSPEQCWLPVVIVSGERAHFLERYGEGAAGDGETVQRYMSFDPENWTSITTSVRAARENARSIREVVSLEAFQVINELYLWVTSDAARREYDEHRYGYYRRVRELAQLALGLMRSTMLHDTPLDFIWLGLMLERAGQTARVLDVHHHALTTLRERHPIVETALWLGLLRACSGFEGFMKKHQGRVSGDAVAAFLVLEPSFPRSLRFCVRDASLRFRSIRPSNDLPGQATSARLTALEAYLADKTAESLAPVHDLLTHVVDETSATYTDLARELLGIGDA